MQSLIDGYVRELERALKEQYTPNEIKSIILNYYLRGTLICYLTRDHRKPWYIAANVMSNEPIVWKSKAVPSTNQSPGHTKPCIGYNISSMLSVDASKYNTAIFHCGGFYGGYMALSSKQCEAIIFDSNNLHISTKGIVSFYLLAYTN